MLYVAFFSISFAVIVLLRRSHERTMRDEATVASYRKIEYRFN